MIPPRIDGTPKAFLDFSVRDIVYIGAGAGLATGAIFAFDDMAVKLTVAVVLAGGTAVAGLYRTPDGRRVERLLMDWLLFNSRTRHWERGADAMVGLSGEMRAPTLTFANISTPSRPEDTRPEVLVSYQELPDDAYADPEVVKQELVVLLLKARKSGEPNLLKTAVALNPRWAWRLVRVLLKNGVAVRDGDNCVRVENYSAAFARLGDPAFEISGFPRFQECDQAVH